MKEDRFWQLIDRARAGASASAAPQDLAAVLTPLDDAELKDFGLAFYEKLCDLNQWKLWGAGYVIAGGMGDDSFHYFRSWIIGKGKLVFDTALTQPDDLGPFIDDPEVDNESLEYVMIELFEERGSGIDPRDGSERSPDFNPEGTPFDEATVYKAYPKLAVQFG